MRRHDLASTSADDSSAYVPDNDQLVALARRMHLPVPAANLRQWAAYGGPHNHALISKSRA